jgi:hypothetical protein
MSYYKQCQLKNQGGCLRQLDLTDIKIHQRPIFSTRSNDGVSYKTAGLSGQIVLLKNADELQKDIFRLGAS